MLGQRVRKTSQSDVGQNLSTNLLSVMLDNVCSSLCSQQLKANAVHHYMHIGLTCD